MRTLQLSFAGGEVSPEMVGRPDARQYATGAKKLLNYQPLPQGPVTRRAGTQHVAAASNHTLERRLIPFVYSTDQAMIVELRNAVIRFHVDGQTLLHTARHNIGETGIDTSGTSIITFESEHGFSENDKIRITWPIVATIPTGLARGTDYYVIVVDSYRIKVGTSDPAASSLVTISGTAAGYARAWLADDLPRDWDAPSVGGTFFNISTERVEYTGHPYEVGDAVQFKGATSPVWPIFFPSLDPVTADTTYYVSEVGTDWFRIARTPGGDSEDLSGPTSGTFTSRRYYRQGELMYWDGSGTLDPGVYYCKTDHQADVGGDPGVDAGNWWRQSDDGTLTVPTGYTEAQLPDITHAQSNDIVTLTHKGQAPRELRRLGATHWDLRAISFTSTEAVPDTVAVVADRGSKVEIGANSPVRSSLASGGGAYACALFAFDSDHNLASGDAVYLERLSPGDDVPASGYYTADIVPETWAATLRDLDGNPVLYDGLAASGGTADVYYASLSADTAQSYKVTAVSASGVESTPSTATGASNNLDVQGAKNTITWNGTSPKYRVYRLENGLYGYIGESDVLAFVDDGIDADLGRTPPIADTDWSGVDYPRACGYFEQRRAFGGTSEKPRQIWMTKSGTESDLTYSLPIKDDDRISVGLAAREAATIRHIVPMADMILLTQQGEWRVTAINSDAITPETVAVRQQSEIGANSVRPLVVNNTIVFAANRGGHVRTMSFNWQAQGYVTGDLSLRATHLFDGLTIKDSTYSKAPYPVLWFVSSSGKLLSLTYVPEEEVAGWAVHDVGGTVESVCAIPEGDGDSVYVVVKRTVNGAEERHIERIVPHLTEDLTDGVYVDAAVTYDGLETSGRTLKVTGGKTWVKGETVTVTASAHLFKDRTEIGDELELRDAAGGKYRVRIKSYVSSTVVTATLLRDVPTALQRTGVATWAFARKTIPVGSHFEAATVDIVSDGVVQTPQVVTGGEITLPVAGVKVHVGHNYVSDIETLPVTVQQIEGAGRGRQKNVSRVNVRVLESAGLKVGPDAERLAPVEDMDTTKMTTGEARVVPPGHWGADGEILIRQDQPRPSTVLGLTMDVELGD